MKSYRVLLTIVRIGTLWGSLLQASIGLSAETPTSELAAAVRALAAQKNYSWETTTETKGVVYDTNRGKARVDGVVWLRRGIGRNFIENDLFIGDEILVNRIGWQKFEWIKKLHGGEMYFRRHFKAPVAQLEHVLRGLKDVKKAGDSFSGTLDPEYASYLAAPALAQGAPTPIATGTFKLALTNGVIAGYEFNVHSTNMDRSTSDAIVRIQIKDIGKTHIEIPAEAMELLGK